MKRILLNTLFLIYSLASYAGDRLPREEPFSFTDIIFALLCAILIPLFMALKDKNKSNLFDRTYRYGKSPNNIYILNNGVHILYSCKYKECKNELLSSNLDNALQVKATSILENKLIELNALSGQAIIMEIQTGHIKAMVGLDRKDSADYQPCKNFSQAHESALIQPISILAALESGKVTLSDKVDVGNGIYSIQDRELKDHNWHRGGYGEISIKQGLASSSNIAVYKTMEKAFGNDAQAYFNLLKNMSYGKPDSIAGIANLKPAYFVTPKDSGWSDTAFAWFCIGYNQTITPCTNTNLL